MVKRPDRRAARRALRHALKAMRPDLSVIAEGFLTERSEVDLLAVSRKGELTAIRIADPGEEAASLIRILSDLTWLGPRAAHFLKLAPGLALEPSAAPRGLLCAASFDPETQAAAAHFAKEVLELYSLRCFRREGRLGALLEPLSAGTPVMDVTRNDSDTPAHPEFSQSRQPAPSGAPFSPIPPSPADGESRRTPLGSDRGGFRTGLSEADLHLIQAADSGS